MKNLLMLLFVMFLLTFATQSLIAAEPPTTQEATTTDDQAIDDPFADKDTAQLQVFDPLEPVNRGFFWFNDKLYFFIFKPIAKGFRLIPEPGRVSLGNFISNLGTPVRMANSLLQFKFKDAGNEFCRFFINSTIGVAGLFDIAAQNGLPQKDEDLGQTFGHYGIGSGPYLVLPVLGPSNLRDGIGSIGDTFLDPLNYHLKREEAIIIEVVDGVNELSLDKDTYEGIQKHEIDPYLFIRNAYEQNRAAKVNE